MTTSMHHSLLNRGDLWSAIAASIQKNPESSRTLASRSEHWLSFPSLNIVEGKKHLAPSGNPQDYCSVSAYLWPDPDKPNGIPWITRDGEVNPLFYEHDNVHLELMCHAVPELILHARVSASSEPAQHASSLLRSFFNDSNTRMNPHLDHAQIATGTNEGSFWGIIDTTSLVFLLDAATQLNEGDDWTAEDHQALQRWALAYLEWLLKSPHGKEESIQPGNHGTWYDAQVLALSKFGNGPLDIVEYVKEKTLPRIASQFKEDGTQPHELARTLSLTYCTYNLLGFACVARLIAPQGIDLWSLTSEGRSLRQGLEWMQPFFNGEPWAHQQIRPFDPAAAALLLALASSDSALSKDLAPHPMDQLLFSKPRLACRKLPGIPE